MEQLLLHLVGDYVLQTDWMAVNKVKRWFPALVHALVYSGLFLLFRPSWSAFAAIAGTHFIIDRYRVARYVVFVKNRIGGSLKPWSECSVTGYHHSMPIWMATWLVIITDNTMHLVINYSALKWL